MAAVCGGGGGGGVGGGGGSGDSGGDDGGATEAAAGTALHQTARVVAATRLDFYSAFALWAWATAGVRLQPHSHCRVWSGCRSRRFRQPMSLSKPKRCSSRRLPSRRLACQHDRKDLCAKAWSHRTTKAGAACKCLRRRRGRRRSLAAAAHSGHRRGDGLLQSPKRPLARVSCDSGDQNGSFLQNPGMRLQLG